MAQPISPFSGSGGYGSIMSPYYHQISQQVADEYIARENAKVDNAIKVASEIRNLAAASFGAPAEGGGVFGDIGRATGFTKDAGLMNVMNPSSLSQYYAQASELDKKSSAAKKMLEVNPELFGLNQEQAKQLGDVTGKMSSTERYEFFQQYVPTLFKAQQAKLEQEAVYKKALAGIEPVPNLSGMAEGLRGITGGQPAPSSPVAPQPAPSVSPEMQTKGLQVPRTPSFDEATLNSADYYMRKTYGPKWREEGRKITDQDLRNAGIIP